MHSSLHIGKDAKLRNIISIVLLGSLLTVACHKSKSSPRQSITPSNTGDSSQIGDSKTNTQEEQPSVTLDRNKLFFASDYKLEWNLEASSEESFLSKDTAAMIRVLKQETPGIAVPDCPIRTKRLILPYEPRTLGFRPRLDFSLEFQAPAKLSSQAAVFDIQVRYALANSDEVKQIEFPVHVYNLIPRSDSGGSVFIADPDAELSWYMKTLPGPLQWVEIELCNPLPGITQFSWAELGLILFLGSTPEHTDAT
jgi:hypothetical protein